MLTILDLNPRQLSRVVEQLLRAKAELELSPRTWQDEQALSGRVSGRDASGLLVDVTDRSRDVPLISLVGVCCDVRLQLDGCVYVFSSSVLDVIDTSAPQRLVIGVPQSMHLTNRRRYFRAAATDPTPVSIHAGGSDEQIAGELWDIGPAGLSASVATADADRFLLLGDSVRVQFVVPETGASFMLPATICNKKPHAESNCMLVGLEFEANSNSDSAVSLDRLRALLCQVNLEIREEGR
ncbi:MAG: PilZ domain-containing protein [Phycisphaerales bacterium]|nr:PilZ domain-containing protein [Phycisphaerales bacterium]